MNIEELANELVLKEEIIFKKDEYLYRISISPEEGVGYDIYPSSAFEKDLDEVEPLDGGFYELEKELTKQEAIKIIDCILE